MEKSRPRERPGNGLTVRRMEMGKLDKFGPVEARRIGDMIGVNWKKYPLEEFRMGLHVELEHGARDSQTNVTDDDIIMTGKIALAHLKEFPDYYTRLNELEEEAEGYWERKKKEKGKGKAKAAKSVKVTKTKTMLKGTKTRKTKTRRKKA